MLRHEGVDSNLVQVIDGNDIDREVVKYNPDIVVIEAIWVTPAKLRELSRLHHHRHRHWIVRNHSEIPFLATEGISLKWIHEYAEIHRTRVACNSPVAAGDIAFLTGAGTLMLPNYYPHRDWVGDNCSDDDKPSIDVGCFGAIRPLKNNVEQGIGALRLAKSRDKYLRFHVNASRLEDGSSVLKALRQMFHYQQEKGYGELVEHRWLNHVEFLALCRTMDLGMQVSFSETFNIVSADFVGQGVPVVTSPEVPWIDEDFQANPGSSEDMAEKCDVALGRGVVERQQQGLRLYSEAAKKIWLHLCHS
jgi:hypothetical protein